MLRRAVRSLPVAIVGAIAMLLALLGGTATAARLVGGREQAAVLRAFAHTHGTRPEQATSVRAANGSAGWVVVRWVIPATGTERRPSNPVLHSTYFHVSGGRVGAGSPPAAARSDLAAHFAVAVLYTGSGSETISYQQSTRSICVGNGSYVDAESVTVRPMSWTVRYVVDLDRLQAAVTDGRFTALLPTVSFDRGRSALSALEQLTRTSTDQGCFGPTRTVRCTNAYSLRVPGAPSQLGVGPAGLQIGIPMSPSQRGDCTADAYPLGPSLWAGGAATAAVNQLSLSGGRLPANPYAPLKVAWPFSSAHAAQGFLTSPCQGNTARCTDTLRWTGSVRLQPLGG